MVHQKFSNFCGLKIFKEIFKNKKSQIYATLTWFVAFIIIFFIILLFISASIIIAGKREVPIITVGGDSTGLEAQRSLIEVLNNKINYDNQQIKISQLIKKWTLLGDKEVKLKIGQEVKQILENNLKEESCYFFHAEYGLEEFKKNIEEASKRDSRAGMYSEVVINQKTIELTNLNQYQKKEFLNYGPEIIIFSGDNKIKIKLGIGGIQRCS
jgi:hypothetical protein